MKGSAKLKDQARSHEQREEWEAAIDIYLRVLKDSDDRDVADLPLYNRVGDLYLRLGRADDAVRYYEQAAAHYAEAELYNNAIALCNKALRYAPARLDLLRKLGVYSAEQGFLTDARHWFLEFAERAFRKGEMDAAFAALEEFAHISDEAEIRELLARKLHSHDREDDAASEFRRAYKMRVRAGHTDAAEALRQEVLELWPENDLGTSGEMGSDEGDEAHSRDSGLGLPTLSDEMDGVPTARGLPGLEPTHGAVTPPAEPQAAPLEGFEQTSLAEEEEPDEAFVESAAGPAGSAEVDDESVDQPEDDVRWRPGSDEDDDAFEDDTVETIESFESTSYDDSADAPGETGGLPSLPTLPPVSDAGDEEPVASDGWPEPLPYQSHDLEPESPLTAGSSSSHGSHRNGDAGSDWVDLSDLLGVNEQQKEESRFFVEETDPSGDEDRDFADLLAQFKQKLSEHIAHDDVGSHYDLGLAFKEMGLLDEAVNQFQTALRAGSTDRLKIYEELGHCFLMKQQYKIAVKVLSRALQFDHGDEMELIGVYYLLGRAYEEMHQSGEAMDAYERVVGLDIAFKDVGERMARL
jgi:tetratricopeptide (TPR) repeat protein